MFRLVPPRPSFVDDASGQESAIMAEHGAYWAELTAEGTALVFGPVDDPDGVWGIAVVEAEDHAAADALAAADPAVRTGTCRGQMLPMLSATVRDR